MARPPFIELPECDPIPIIYEDRSIIAIDKPRGWMLVPHTWQKTSWNLQAAITSSIAGRDYWATSRGLKFLRFIHRLDADTSGILLFAKSLGSMAAFGDMFEERQMEKTYLAVCTGEPREQEWLCQFKLGPDSRKFGRQRVDSFDGKSAETFFKVLDRRGKLTLVEARPVTGRTHQIRVHLAESGMPIVSDELYGHAVPEYHLGLRAVRLAYADPFTKRRIEIRAPIDEFLEEYSFTGVKVFNDPARPDRPPQEQLKPKPAPQPGQPGVAPVKGAGRPFVRPQGEPFKKPAPKPVGKPPVPPGVD